MGLERLPGGPDLPRRRPNVQGRYTAPGRLDGYLWQRLAPADSRSLCDHDPATARLLWLAALLCARDDGRLGEGLGLSSPGFCCSVRPLTEAWWPQDGDLAVLEPLVQQTGGLARNELLTGLVCRRGVQGGQSPTSYTPLKDNTSCGFRNQGGGVPPP